MATMNWSSHAESTSAPMLKLLMEDSGTVLALRSWRGRELSAPLVELDTCTVPMGLHVCGGG